MNEPVLSPRQREILELVSRGHSNARIAEFLGLSISTVVNHLRHVYEAFGVSDRAHAVRAGFESGVLWAPVLEPVERERRLLVQLAEVMAERDGLRRDLLALRAGARWAS